MVLMSICLVWAFATAGVTFLPQRERVLADLILIAMSPALIVGIWLYLGWFGGLAAAVSVWSVYRAELPVYWARLRGVVETAET